MRSEFDRATALTAAGDGTRTADLDPLWTVGGRPHGGYLLALLARAASSPTHPHLLAISASFSKSPRLAPVQVEVEEIRAGRSLSQFRTRLTQDGTSCADALVTLGRLEDDEPWWTSVEQGGPAEEDCLLMPAQGPGGFPIDLLKVVEQRIEPAAAGFMRGEPARRGEITTWHRLADGADWDPLSLLVPLDPVPPISYDLGLTGWAPTIQMSAHVRRLPAPGPVRIRMVAGDVGGQRMDETAQAFDSRGRLVAHATQIAGVRH
ncbi:thioesterase family protein [Actinosynnema pretiosum subsp. pretiosum]|uniref:Thioesterase family protein n=1 Tax=Actinosynnema pretiosum subsp. pretiosum TaxID=103721 RepID=A0AA45L5R1_9PSEU|nr:TesB-like acyl-CoA thioesterase 3 [Actinosynnema pretiosum subsp. pretiosum]QUF03680.1 thioesterase family protein [Actinosynnema pretiosum subsp. pretiosum]